MPAEKLELIPDNLSLWSESMLWSKDITLRSGIGYKDNVFLTPTRRGSGFFINGLDAAVNRLPLDGLECIFFVTGDDTRYWRDVPPPTNAPASSVRTVDHEDVLLVSAMAQKYFTSSWRAGAEFKESYVDQVQYILIQNGLTNAVVNGNVLDGRLFVRHDFNERWRLQLDGLISRSLFAPLPLDDSWRYGPRLTFGYQYGHSSDVALAWTGTYQQHDLLRATDENNMPIAGKRLAAWHQRAELNWQHYYDEHKHWRSTTTLAFHYNEDNGAGFYSYYRYTLVEELRWRNPRWELKASGRVSYDDWPVARADGDLSGPTLHRMIWGLGCRAERQIYKALRCFGEYSFEETVSNSPSDEYQANVATVGLSLEF